MDITNNLRLRLVIISRLLWDLSGLLRLFQVYLDFPLSSDWFYFTAGYIWRSWESCKDLSFGVQSGETTRPWYPCRALC